MYSSFIAWNSSFRRPRRRELPRERRDLSLFQYESFESIRRYLDMINFRIFSAEREDIKYVHVREDKVTVISKNYTSPETSEHEKL